MKEMRRAAQKGQALLIVLLVTAVALTVGLAAVSRSVTDVQISKEEEEAVRAFSAAEAGIEEVLGSLPELEGYSGNLGEGLEVAASAETGGESGFETGPVAEGEVVEVNLEGSGLTASQIDVCWNGEGALEIVIIKEESGEDKIEKGVYGGSFEGAESGNCGSSLSGVDTRVRVAIPTGGGVTPIAMRIRPLQEDSYIVLRPTEGGLPSQHYVIESTGRVVETGVTRKIRVTRAIKPALPAFFDYALFSGGVLVK